MVYRKAYRPSKFTIGYRDGKVNSSPKIGYPTCKWLREGKWTELGRFSNHTGGYKPHQQRDEKKQLKKDLGMKLEELDNEPISGFRVLEAHHGYASNDHFIRVLDPRGFCLCLDPRFVENTILKYHLGISGSGEIEGKWFYLWGDEKFVGIRPESELSSVVVDDHKLAALEKNLKSYTIEDLVVGKVYVMTSTNGDKSEGQRVVYVGQKVVPNMPTIRNFVCNGYNIDTLGRYWDRIKYGVSKELASSAEYLPWNRASDAKKAQNATRAWKLQPCFILLEDMIGSDKNSEKDAIWYCDDLAGVPFEEKEHSIKFCDCCYYNYGESSLVVGKDVVKRLINESKDQDLRIISASHLPYWRTRSNSVNQQYRYKSISDYKTIKLETLVMGLDRYLLKLKKFIEDRLEFTPAARPTDLKSWLGKVGKWYKEVYEPSHQRRSWW